MNQEDEEFERIEQEIKRRQAAEDDDTQEYAAQRQWVGLTDEERRLLFNPLHDAPFEFARAIEAKLKEKNT
jgi:hypothetical protein